MRVGTFIIARRYNYNAYMRTYMRTYRKASPPLNITLSKEQRRRFESAAKTAGYTVTAFFRKAACAYLDQHRVLPAAYDQALLAATLEIRRIGNSINQLAHHANIKRHTGRRELERANQLLTEL